MGPKAKKKGKADQVIGEYPIEEMTEPELQDYAVKLYETLIRTREQTEVVEKEKQRLECFWLEKKREFERKRRKLAAAEAEAGELKADFETLLFSKEEKLEYLQQENLQNLLKQTVQANINRLQYEEIHLGEKKVTADRVNQKMDESQKVEITYENMVQRLRQMRRDEISELIKYHEDKLSQTTWKYESLYGHLWDTINVARLNLLREAETNRNKRIEAVDERRTIECQQMREYFNRIAFDCLALIGDLKIELESLKKSDKEQKKLLRDAINENENLRKLRQEAESAKLELEQYTRSKKSFSKARSSMFNYMARIKDLEFENHMLSQKVENVSKQIEDLNVQFSDSVRRLQKSSSLKSVFLERKLKALRSMLEPKDKEEEPKQSHFLPLLRRPRRTAPQSSSQKATPYPVNVVNMQLIRDAQIHFVPPTNLEL